MMTPFQKSKLKLAQAGSLMVEAMAMLALISLVTPTLYKKSAERTTELQDINTASHARTVLKALDNYVKTNYSTLMEEMGSGDSTKKISAEDLAKEDGDYKPYFPFGYKFEDLKNFAAPQAALMKKGDSITVFVDFPTNVDLGEIRAARIASMIGSNGGYINKDEKAQGVGGVWSLETTDLTNMGFDTDKKDSIVVASSDAINSAMAGALENEKYLQRTKPETESERWRNAMTTDLYMGGVANAETMYKILGVEQLILGETDSPVDADLVITEDATSGGAAWMAGALHALNETFNVEGTPEDASLDFGEAIKAQTGEGTTNRVSFNNEDIIFEGSSSTGTGGETSSGTALFKVKTTVDNALESTGDTRLANKDNSVFEAGPNGKYIKVTPEQGELSLMDGNIITKKVTGQDNGVRTDIKTKLYVNDETNIGTVGTMSPEATSITNFDPKLKVWGDAYVDETLYANDLKVKKFDTLSLRAGKENFGEGNWRLNVTDQDFEVQDKNGNTRLSLNEGESTVLNTTGTLDNYGRTGSSIQLDDGVADIRGKDTLNLHTQNFGNVDIQSGALTVQGTSTALDGNSKVIAKAPFMVHTDNEGTSDNATLYADPNDNGEVQINAQNTQITSYSTLIAPQDKGNSSNGVFAIGGNLTSTDNGAYLDNIAFRVQPKVDANTASSDNSIVDVYENAFILNEKDQAESDNPVVYADLNKGSDSTTEGSTKINASIYIRRGAIEVEPETNEGFDADDGKGYIEASRFVANNPGTDKSTPIVPIFAGEYDESIYYQNESPRVAYDRYMINPAYTSVMHDIKLTTRGGARLSDILPDFINKGIYLVNNSYTEEGTSFDNIKPTVTEGGRIETNFKEQLIGGGYKNTYASAFMGIVPAPQCPPGYARVITLTPATFQMAQAGNIRYVNLRGGENSDTNLSRFEVVSLSNESELTNVKKSDIKINEVGQDIISGARWVNITQSNGSSRSVLGDPVEGTDDEDKVKVLRTVPFSFQQNTWLRSMVQTRRKGSTDSCGDNKSGASGSQSANVSCPDFIGWSAIMGFIYPETQYKGLIDAIETLSGGSYSTSSDDSNKIYWNLYPVQTSSLEAYATVYCYFDRSNLWASSGQDSTMVDKYDQLNNFSSAYTKTRTNDQEGNYVNRLDDPALKYRDPW